MRTDAEIHGILTEWGHWKTGIPKERRNRPDTPVCEDDWGEPGGMPPGPVWMTPVWEIVLFHDVSGIVSTLPGVHRLTVKETYLNPYKKQMAIARTMGINESTLRRYQEQARVMVARSMEMLKFAREIRAV
jgi:hypothetical protein